MQIGSLIITRRFGESFVLRTTDGDILVELQKNAKGGAKVRISAPNEVNIVRTELIEEPLEILEYQCGRFS